MPTSLHLLSRRIAALINPAHALGALLVAGLLLSSTVAHDALVVTVSTGWRLG
jgi:hypothetical protein